MYTCVLIAGLGGTAPRRVCVGRVALSPTPLLQGGEIVSAPTAAIGRKLMMTHPKTEAFAAVVFTLISMPRSIQSSVWK